MNPQTQDPNTQEDVNNAQPGVAPVEEVTTVETTVTQVTTETVSSDDVALQEIESEGSTQPITAAPVQNATPVTSTTPVADSAVESTTPTATAQPDASTAGESSQVPQSAVAQPSANSAPDLANVSEKKPSKTVVYALIGVVVVVLGAAGYFIWQSL